MWPCPKTFSQVLCVRHSGKPCLCFRVLPRPQELVKLPADGACYGRRKPAGHHAHVITPMKPTRRTVAAIPGLLIASNRL